MDETMTLLLGALLHDVGKIVQREDGEYHLKHAAFSGNFVSSLKGVFGAELTKQLVTLIEKHHSIPSTREELILHIADKLSSVERQREKREKLRSNEAALVAVASRVRFKRDRGNERYYKLKPLSITEEALFPNEMLIVERGAYQQVWEGFVQEIQRLPKYQETDFITLYSILRKFGSLVPSATPWEQDEYARTIPDVSLFDHSKVTCAIASCLAKMDEKEFTETQMKDLIEVLRKYNEEGFDEILERSDVAKKPLFLLIRGDVAGIQRFIYSITSPEGETKGMARRLRGRSFYVSILTEVIADWIVRSLNLPLTNILFCGGGRFDLLLPYNRYTSDCLDTLELDLNKWLLRKFFGELSIQIARVKIAAQDFFNFGSIYRKAEDSLLKTKQQKFLSLINEEDFFRSSQNVEAICKSCLMVPVKNDQSLCYQCEMQKELGGKLPKTEYLAYVYGDHKFEDGTYIYFDKFGVTIYLLDRYDISKFWSGKETEQNIVVYRLNPDSKNGKGLDFLPECLFQKRKEGKTFSFGFKFLGNSAPVKKEDREVLDFEEIATLSQGARYLGILKMDVDYLGSIFGLGIEPPSISRFATLSSNFEIFFTAWLNELCQSVTKQWENNLVGNDLAPGSLESIFYLIYSGGDDLLIIGPWDQVIELSGKIYEDFRRYTSENPNVTLSGGIIFVKPHFPVQRFAQLVEEELEKSKHYKEKDRITIFNETVEWRDDIRSFCELITFAKGLAEYVKDKDLPKGFVYFLGMLEKVFNIGTDKKEDINWVPQFLYTLARRVPKAEVQTGLKSKVMEKKGKLKIPVSYVSLKTRKE